MAKSISEGEAGKKNILAVLANSEILFMTEDDYFPENMRAYLFEPNTKAYMARMAESNFELMPTAYLTVIPVGPDKVISYNYTTIRHLPKCLDEQYFYALGHLECDVTGTIMILEGKGENLGAVVRVYLPRFDEEMSEAVELLELDTLQRNIADGLGEGSVVEFSAKEYLAALPEPYRQECISFQKKRAERFSE